MESRVGPRCSQSTWESISQTGFVILVCRPSGLLREARSGLLITAQGRFLVVHSTEPPAPQPAPAQLCILGGLLGCTPSASLPGLA